MFQVKIQKIKAADVKPNFAVKRNNILTSPITQKE